MAAVKTTQIMLGFQAPLFTLLDTISGKNMDFADLKGENGTVVMFICNHCPFVVHVIDELVKLGNDYKEKGIGFIAISSNDVANYPQDGPDLMKQLAEKKQFPFPYLYDETQDVARAYDAACTPDFSIFDAQNICIYRGQLDDSRPTNEIPVDGGSIRTVLDALLANVVYEGEQKPSIGCNIKWKK